MSIRVIGCGNLDRGDDAAGILVARRLRELGCDACEHSGEATSLMAVWEGADYVILVDAVSTGAPSGTVSVWEARTAPLDGGVFHSTHGFGVGEAIRLAKPLGKLPRRIVIYGVEGSVFDLGAKPSTSISAGVEKAAVQILQVVRAAAH